MSVSFIERPAAYRIGTVADLAAADRAEHGCRYRVGSPDLASATVKHYVGAAMAGMGQAPLAALYFDEALRLIATEPLAAGAEPGEAPAAVRSVLKAALNTEACAVILVIADKRHTRPDGQIHRDVAAALQLIGVELLDCLDLSGDRVESLAELGYL
jgi:DNA repair protein RadC